MGILWFCQFATAAVCHIKYETLSCILPNTSSVVACSTDIIVAYDFRGNPVGPIPLLRRTPRYPRSQLKKDIDEPGAIDP